MYTCICMYVCMYLCIYVYMYVCMYASTNYIIIWTFVKHEMFIYIIIKKCIII